MKLAISEASRITARLRPNPVFSFDGDHINPSTINNPPTEISLRIDVPIETGENMGAYSAASSTHFNGFPPAKVVHVNQ